MRRFVLAGLVLLSACGDPGRAPNTPNGQQRYEATGHVLESREHGPELCLGVLLESLPPQCGGIPLDGWDWAKATGKESAEGTTWGLYRVVGTFDGKTFTLTEPPGSPPPAEPYEPIGTPCPKPPGGYPVPDPSKITVEDFEAASRAAEAEPDFAGNWIDAPLLASDGESYSDYPNAVMNVAFTGDLERHEAEIRKLWGGRLCLSEFEHTLAKLERIKDELTARAESDFGLRMLLNDADDVKNVVNLHVVFADQDDQKALDERYGKGVVVLTAAIKPLSD